MAGEEIILSGTEETLKPIISLLVGVYQLLEDRDICTIVGTPTPSSLRAETSKVKLAIHFSTKKQPPFRNQRGQRRLDPIYKISDIDVRKLTWENVKRAAGGAEGYNWGRFCATANLSNRREMQVYAGSKEEAKERILAFSELSKAEIFTLTIREEQNFGVCAKGKLLYKETTRVYPAYFTVITNEKLLIETEKKAYEPGIVRKLEGDFKRKKTTKIPLWTIEEPPNTKEAIREVLKSCRSTRDDD